MPRTKAMLRWASANGVDQLPDKTRQNQTLFRRILLSIGALCSPQGFTWTSEKPGASSIYPLISSGYFRRVTMAGA